MPGFFDIFFRPEPEPEPSKPKPKKVKKVEKAKPFVHPLKKKVASLEAELASLRQPKPEPESEADEPSE